jgi:PilZ domain-containing protein
MADLRKSPRRAFHYNATIVIDGETQSHPCAIVDISNTGARLQLKDDFELPEHFLLLLTRGGGARRRCKIIWRDGLFAGVQFPTPQS